MRHLYWDLGETGGGAIFEVDWRGSTARVCLLDSDEYQAYLDEEAYQYHGGFYDYSPITLQVPGVEEPADSRWRYPRVT